MKVAVFSESPADEAAIRILLDGLLGRTTQVVPFNLRERGWTSVAKLLPNVLKYLQYNTDADALVVVVDSDDSPIHQPTHDEPGTANMECRLCRLRKVIATTSLTPMPNRTPLKIAIGIAVPAIEAWYQCGVDPQVNEMAWGRKLQGQPCAYTKLSLKRAVYGTDRPALQAETRHAQDAARRLVQELPLLEQRFPNGFKPFAREVRSW